MPKQQLKFPIALKDKIKVAFKLNGLKVENAQPIGEYIFADVTHNGQNLVDALLMTSSLTGKELEPTSSLTGKELEPTEVLKGKEEKTAKK